MSGGLLLLVLVLLLLVLLLLLMMMMMVPLAYAAVKRIKRLKAKLKPYVSMRTLLTWHVYAGILGLILVLLHTGHQFESPLGIALTAMTLVAVTSGFVGRYLMNQFSVGIREKKAMLAQLEAAYEKGAAGLASDPQRAALLRPFAGFPGRLDAALVTAILPPAKLAEANLSATLGERVGVWYNSTACSWWVRDVAEHSGLVSREGQNETNSDPCFPVSAERARWGNTRSGPRELVHRQLLPFA